MSKPLRIAVADDEPEMRDYLRETLHQQTHDLRQALEDAPRHPVVLRDAVLGKLVFNRPRRDARLCQPARSGVRNRTLARIGVAFAANGP